MPLSRINWVARPQVKFAAAPGSELSQEAAAALPETVGNDTSADPGQDIPGTDVAVRTEAAAVPAKEQSADAEAKAAAQKEQEQAIRAANQKTANNSFECIKAMLLSEKTRKDQLKSTLERDIEVTNMSIQENRKAYSKLERQVAPQPQPQMLSPDQTMFLNAGQGMNRTAQFAQAMAPHVPAAAGLVAAAAAPAPAFGADPDPMLTAQGQRPNEQFQAEPSVPNGLAGGQGQTFGYQSSVPNQFLQGYMPNANMQQNGMQQDAPSHIGRADTPGMNQQQTPFQNMMPGQLPSQQVPAQDFSAIQSAALGSASATAQAQFSASVGQSFNWNQIQSQNQSSFNLQGQTPAAMSGSQLRSDTSYQQAQMLQNSAQPQYSSAPGQNVGSQLQPQPVNFGGNAAQPYQNRYQSHDNTYQGQNQNNWYQNQSQDNSYQNRSQNNQYQDLSQSQGNSYQSQDRNNSYWGYSQSSRYPNQQDNTYQSRSQNNRYPNQQDNSYQGRSQNNRYQNQQDNTYQSRSQGNRYQNQQDNTYQGRSQNNRYQNQQDNSYQGRSQNNRYQNQQDNSYQGRSQNSRYQNQQDNSCQGRSQNNQYQNQPRFNQFGVDGNGVDVGNMAPAAGASPQMRVEADLYILQSDHVGYLNDMLMFLQSKNIHFAFFDADRAYQPQDIVLLPNNYQIPDLNCRVFFYHEFNKKDLWAFLKDTLGQRGFKLN